MELYFLKSKLHRATVTDANLNYEGSVTIDAALMEAAHILSYERVEIYNITNGERFSTYAIAGNKGTICINGAAAWKARVGDRIIIATYCLIKEEELKTRKIKPVAILLGENNEILNRS